MGNITSTHDMIELKEEEMDFIEISSGSGDEIISLGNFAGNNGTLRTAPGCEQYFQRESFKYK